MRRGPVPVIPITQTAAWRRRHPEEVPLTQIAAIDFEPVGALSVITAATFAQAVQQHAPAAAEAAAVVAMRKAELVAMVARAREQGDGSEEMLALMLEEARIALQSAADLMTSASARLRVAQAVVTIAGQREASADDMCEPVERGGPA